MPIGQRAGFQLKMGNSSSTKEDSSCVAGWSTVVQPTSILSKSLDSIQEICRQNSTAMLKLKASHLQVRSLVLETSLVPEVYNHRTHSVLALPCFHFTPLTKPRRIPGVAQWLKLTVRILRFLPTLEVCTLASNHTHLSV